MSEREGFYELSALVARQAEVLEGIGDSQGGTEPDPSVWGETLAIQVKAQRLAMVTELKDVHDLLSQLARAVGQESIATQADEHSAELQSVLDNNADFIKEYTAD